MLESSCVSDDGYGGTSTHTYLTYYAFPIDKESKLIEAIEYIEKENKERVYSSPTKYKASKVIPIEVKTKVEIKINFG